MTDARNAFFMLIAKIKGALSFKKAQTLTDDQKDQLLENIGTVELEITYDDDSTGTLTVAGKLEND